jgi:hypothetical protein
MDPSADEPPFGIKVNLDPYRSDQRRDQPTWPTRHQGKWYETGVNVWDRTREQIVYLAPHRALALLAHLRATTTWQAQGITIGDTLYTLPKDPVAAGSDAPIPYRHRLIRRPMISRRTLGHPTPSIPWR